MFAPWASKMISMRSSQEIVTALEEGEPGRILDALKFRGVDQQALFKAAREARDRVLGHSAILRGVVELTNLCRMSCLYCPMRRGGVAAEEHYLLSQDLIAAAIERICADPINVVSLQSGETPRVAELAIFATRVAAAKAPDRREVLLCLGKQELQVYEDLRASGADSYIMKFETSDVRLHETLRGEPLETRLSHIRALQSIGFAVGTGSIVGLPGQPLESVADDIQFGVALGTAMLSVSPFIPGERTPLRHAKMGDRDTTLNAISIMRLMSPAATIPTVSALELTGGDGQLAGLMAGANVVTVNYTPSREAGLYHIYRENRFRVPLDHALRVIDLANLSCTEDHMSLPSANRGAIKAHQPEQRTIVEM
jgi:biotin synthase